MNNLQNEIGQKVLNKVETKMNQLIPFSQINDMMNHQDEGQQNANFIRPGTFQEQQDHENQNQNQNQNQIQQVTNLNDNTNEIGNQQMIDYSSIQDGQYQ